jgi:hypothetical protein
VQTKRTRGRGRATCVFILTMLTLIGVLTGGETAQASRVPGNPCQGSPFDKYGQIGSYYPWYAYNRVLRLYNGKARNRTYAILDGARPGDQVWIDRSTTTISNHQTWFATGARQVDNWQKCGALSIQNYPGHELVTEAVDNWHHPVRACMYVVGVGTRCRNWWYNDWH